MKNYLTLVVGSGYTVYSYEINNKEDFTMSIKFTVRSMNSLLRGDSTIHVLKKNGVQMYSVINDDYFVIENGHYDIEEIGFNPDWNVVQLYRDLGYEYITNTDLEDLLEDRVYLDYEIFGDLEVVDTF